MNIRYLVYISIYIPYLNTSELNILSIKNNSSQHIRVYVVNHEDHHASTLISTKLPGTKNIISDSTSVSINNKLQTYFLITAQRRTNLNKHDEHLDQILQKSFREGARSPALSDIPHGLFLALFPPRTGPLHLKWDGLRLKAQKGRKGISTEGYSLSNNITNEEIKNSQLP